MCVGVEWCGAGRGWVGTGGVGGEGGRVLKVQGCSARSVGVYVQCAGVLCSMCGVRRRSVV